MKNNSNTSELYAKAITSMPLVFSSHKFLSKLRRSGMKKDEINSDYHLSFLLNNSERINKFLWKKKEAQIEMPLNTEEVDQINSTPIKYELSEDEMINILKAKGYKVLKQTWNEL